MKAWRPSVRARLFAALVVLTAATLAVGATSWITLQKATARLDRLHNETLASVDRALLLSRQASDLATRAPYLLTLASPFRIRQEADVAHDLIIEITENLHPAETGTDALQRMDRGIQTLVQAATVRSELADRILRRNARTSVLEEQFTDLARRPDISSADERNWLNLQGLARALLGAINADNLVTVGEFHRAYHHLVHAMPASDDPLWQQGLAQLRELAEGPDGLFELRRHEVGQKIAAQAALNTIRKGAEAISLHAANVTAAAEARIAAERAQTVSAIFVARQTIVLIGIFSAVVALGTALYVSGHVTANLRAISDAMTRLAVGDRSSRLPRGEHGGDEIGKLFYAFRAFRANTLKLDRSNRQLAQRNALFQNLYDSMSDGLAILSEEGAVIAGNPHLASVLQVTPQEVQRRPRMTALLDSGGWQRCTGPDGVVELRRPDGRVIEMRESRLSTGGSVMLLSDASERRELSERLRQVQRTEALGKIAGEVAHDFGNILSTISTSLHLMENAPPERMASLRQSLGAALDVGSSLTQRLLAFARRLNLEPEVMDLNDLVAGVEDLIALALDEQVTLAIETAETALTVRIDPGQMESALLNLCLNAAQAIQGSGRIDIRLRHLTEQEMALVEVCDSGQGMSPEVLAHAMEPFFTARSDGTGTGLGLAMVSGFIRQSGGDVEITSQPGKGTCVRLMLPLCVEAATNIADALRVLLVEDDPADAAHARAVLTHSDITETADPDEALRLLQSQVFDLLVTDLHLGPDVAGWRLAEAALQADPDTRAIVVSGHLPARNPLDARFPGRVFGLPKPMKAAALAACLQGAPH
ncbi:ATP-binding protein [Paracoccus seriniphilus]|uniref:histidine kinase n=1 Tax=Paracoccus seriniphilus TaxID=184748 RepID=A0A239Q1P9_9RHOB|nr:ATP-binding protein [Paracoccus seriniphilus]WCR15787.1 response regulator [Paracoccus seriniphilus]SNT76163.1 Signal transduction histidine kinase involved in nitrogen fixation and metabolism regulation [Paracoccus seriniphilus]